MAGDKQQAMFWAIYETFDGSPRSYELEDPGASAEQKKIARPPSMAVWAWDPFDLNLLVGRIGK